MEAMAAMAVGTGATATYATAAGATYAYTGATAAAAMGTAAAVVPAGATLMSVAPATAGLFGAGGSLTAMGVISGASSLFSMAGSMASADMQADMLKGQAAMQDFQARGELIKGKQEGARIRRALAEAVASSNARGGAMGIDITSGSPRDAVAAAAREANEAYDMSDANAKMRAGGYSMRARQSRSEARLTRKKGMFEAGESLLDFAAARFA